MVDHHLLPLQAGGSPKSVTKDHTPSVISSYYCSCSSSSSAERASSVSSQQQGDPSSLHLLDRHAINRAPSLFPQHHPYKESSALEQMIESSAAPTESLSLNLSDLLLDNGHLGTHPTLHQESVPANKLSPQENLIQQQQQQFLATAPSCMASKSHESHVATGLSTSTSEDEVDDTKASRYQGTGFNSLISTLMQQYQAPCLGEDGKISRHPSLNEVLADVRNGVFSNNSAKTNKCLTPKWDEDEKWSSANSAYNGLAFPNVPLFKWSYSNEQALPGMNGEQEKVSVQPSYNKVHLSSCEFQPCHFQTDASKWDKDTLKNEVEKLTDAVSCAQACLERIQPIPPPKNTANSAMNPFSVQGVFQNRTDPTMPFKHGAQGDPVMTKNIVHGGPHVPGASTDFFWSSPIKAPIIDIDSMPLREKHHMFGSSNYLTTSQASQKETFKQPSGGHSGLSKPLPKDTESRADFPKLAEHIQIQKLEKNSQARAAQTKSYMKDACTEITPTSSHRDMGTQMTPVGSSRHSSRPQSPQKAIVKSPAKPNRVTTPMLKGVISASRMNPLEVERCHRAKLELQRLSVQDQVQQSLGKSFDSNWSSREEEEEDIGKGLRYRDLEDLKQDVMEARASAWREATRQKLLAKYEREESKIQAWEELQAAKAEADLKKLEMKLEKKRIQSTAKIASKLCAAHKRAEGRRAAAKAYQVEAMGKTSDRADRMRDEPHVLRVSYPLCACFTHSFD